MEQLIAKFKENYSHELTDSIEQWCIKYKSILPQTIYSTYVERISSCLTHLINNKEIETLLNTVVIHPKLTNLMFQRDKEIAGIQSNIKINILNLTNIINLSFYEIIKPEIDNLFDHILANTRLSSNNRRINKDYSIILAAKRKIPCTIENYEKMLEYKDDMKKLIIFLKQFYPEPSSAKVKKLEAELTEYKTKFEALKTLIKE